jgi:flagellar motor protein MotB
LGRQRPAGFVRHSESGSRDARRTLAPEDNRDPIRAQRPDMKPPARAASASVYRWRVTSGFCAIVTFTVIVAYHVPLYREAVALRMERDALRSRETAANAELEQARAELEQSRARAETLRSERDLPERATARVLERIEKLERLLSAQFGRLAREKMLVISSAGDRVSVAVAVPALFSARDVVTPSGRTLLCELARTIMDQYKGQLRVTGYHGAPRIEDRTLAARHASPWHLAAARAASAASVLEQDCHSPTDRFLVVSYGPRAAGSLGENVALEFVFRPED